MARFLPLTLALLVLVLTLNFRSQVTVELQKLRFANSLEKTELTSSRYVRDIILSSSGKFTLKTEAFWFNKPIEPPRADLTRDILPNELSVLGENSGEKWIEVNLDNQHLYAHEGDRVVFDFPVSSGLPWFPTVTGTFHIWAKLRSTEMIGGSTANGTYYDLPNVPYTQYFYKGFGLHGTYWHHDFGKPRSHGCVNLATPDAEKLFYWTTPTLSAGEYGKYNIDPNVGTKVVVHGTTPSNIY